MRPTGLLALLIVAFAAGVAVGTARAQGPGGSCNAPPVPPPPGAPELAFVDALNQYRQSKGLAPLVLSSLLRRAAMHQAAYGERRNDDFDGDDDHFDNGRAFDRRQNDCGYDFIASKGENLATFEVTVPGTPPDQIMFAPADEAKALLDAFRASPVHEPVQTHPRYRAIGVARVRKAGTFKLWWAVEFGSVRDENGIRPQKLRDIRLPSPDEEPCIPVDGADACDDDRLALWRGDTDAWAPRLEQDNQPVVPEAVMLYTLELRANTGGERSKAILRMIGALP